MVHSKMYFIDSIDDHLGHSSGNEHYYDRELLMKWLNEARDNNPEFTFTPFFI